MLTKMVGLRTSAAIWKKLTIYFASQSRARVKKLKLQLKVSKKDRSISTYILDIKKIVDSLAAIGSPLSDADHIEAILDGLPDDYDGFVTSILSRTEPYTVEEIEALLLAHEERLEKHKQADNVFQVHATTSSWHSSTRGRFQDRAGRQRSRPPSSVRGGRSFKNNSSQSTPSSSHQNSNTSLQCQLCMKYGHTVASCWHRFDQDFQPPIQLHNSQVSPSNIDNCDQLSSISTMPETLWYPDSGASHHITSDSSNFTSKTNYNGSEHVKLGNGSGLAITHVGSANLSSLSNSSSFALHNLLCVPNITKNLLSVSQFAKDNCVYFEFFPSHCNVKHQVTKQILLQGQLKDGIYVFPTLKCSHKPQVHQVSTASSSVLDLWHARMGHATLQTVKRILQSCNISFNTDSVFCNSCAISKIH